MSAREIRISSDQRLAFEHGQRGSVRHVCVKGGAAGRAAQMQARMNIERGRFRHAVAFNHVAVKIADQQRRRGDLGKRHAVGIDQKQIIPARHDKGKMIADPFRVTETRRHPEARRHVDPRLTHGIPVKRAVQQCRAGVAIGFQNMRHDYAFLPIIVSGLTSLSNVASSR